MSLLGIDVGTTRCKSVIFSREGDELGSSYREYDIITRQAGYAELDSFEVWEKIKQTITDVAASSSEDPVEALSVSSMGEALVPVNKNRQILGYSILGNDLRGEEFINAMLGPITPEEVFQINGNYPDVFYSLPKLAWLKKYDFPLYQKADYFLPWADFVCFMLGGKPVTNFGLANRTLLFNIHTCEWSEKLFSITGLDIEKFAPPCPSGTLLGSMNENVAAELSLNSNVKIVCGGHDQCCAALGSGIVGESNTSAMYGMGTYICAVPVYSQIPDRGFMLRNRLNIEHHAAPDLFVSFIYNLSGGALVKWFKRTFVCSHYDTIPLPDVNYDSLFGEVPETISNIIVIPRFGPTGPPEFLKANAGTIAGLSLEHNRGDTLKAILEGITFYFKDFFEHPDTDTFGIRKFIANGGGSRSKIWLQITADILNKPIVRNKITEAGALGAAILAGTGSGIFSSPVEGTQQMVKKDTEILPNPVKVEKYNEKFEHYKRLYSYLR